MTRRITFRDIISGSMGRERAARWLCPVTIGVRLTVGDQSQTAPFDLKLDPRVQVSQADLEQQLNLLLQTRDELSRVYDAVNQIQDVRSQLSGLKRRLPENASAKTIASAADDLEKKLRCGARGTHQSDDQRQRRLAGVSSATGCEAGVSCDGCGHRRLGADRGRTERIREAEAARAGN